MGKVISGQRGILVGAIYMRYGDIQQGRKRNKNAVAYICAWGKNVNVIYYWRNENIKGKLVNGIDKRQIGVI